jgi:hypothetical protein
MEMQELKIEGRRLYLPLCKSTDMWRGILCALPKEGHAFTTKARCPALMMFELEQHPAQMDVASFLFTDLSVIESLTVPVPTEMTINDGNETKVDHELSPTAATQNLQTLFRRSVSNNRMSERPASGVTLGESPSRSDEKVIIGGSIFHTGVKRLSVTAMASPGGSAQSTAAARSKILLSAAATAIDNNSEEVVGNCADINDATDDRDNEETVDSPPTGAAGDTPSLDLKEETTAWTTGSESFEEKTARLRSASNFKHLKNWKLDGLIAKSNDDLRQEVLVL